MNELVIGAVAIAFLIANHAGAAALFHGVARRKPVGIGTIALVCVSIYVFATVLTALELGVEKTVPVALVGCPIMLVGGASYYYTMLYFTKNDGQG